MSNEDDGQVAMFASHAADHLAQRERKLGEDMRRLLLLGDGTVADRVEAAVEMARQHVIRTECLVRAAEDEQ